MINQKHHRLLHRKKKSCSSLPNVNIYLPRSSGWILKRTHRCEEVQGCGISSDKNILCSKKIQSKCGIHIKEKKGIAREEPWSMAKKCTKELRIRF